MQEAGRALSWELRHFSSGLQLPHRLREAFSGFTVLISFNPQSNEGAMLLAHPATCWPLPAMPLVVRERGRVSLTETQVALPEKCR